jgi:hypothetical protein
LRRRKRAKQLVDEVLASVSMGPERRVDCSAEMRRVEHFEPGAVGQYASAEGDPLPTDTFLISDYEMYPRFAVRI